MNINFQLKSYIITNDSSIKFIFIFSKPVANKYSQQMLSTYKCDMYIHLMYSNGH